MWLHYMTSERFWPIRSGRWIGTPRFRNSSCLVPVVIIQGGYGNPVKDVKDEESWKQKLIFSNSVLWSWPLNRFLSKNMGSFWRQKSSGTSRDIYSLFLDTWYYVFSSSQIQTPRKSIRWAYLNNMCTHERLNSPISRQMTFYQTALTWEGMPRATKWYIYTLHHITLVWQSQVLASYHSLVAWFAQSCISEVTNACDMDDMYLQHFLVSCNVFWISGWCAVSATNINLACTHNLWL